MAYGSINEAERTAIFSANNKGKLILLILGSIIFSTAYTLAQERLYRNQSFPAPDGWLTFVTFTVYALLGFLEVTFVWGKGASGSRAAQYNRLPVYASVAALLCTAFYITNVALHLVPYSIKIVVKSCRVLPTMLVSSILQAARFSYQQMGAAVILVFGLGLFLAADSSSKGSQHPFASFGVLMLIFSVLLDAMTANIEEKYFFRTPPVPVSRCEVMAYVSSFASLYCMVPLLYSGSSGWAHVWEHSVSVPIETWLTILLSAVAGYGATSFMLMLIECCGVTTAEIVKNIRKLFQVGCSFLFFPKVVSWMHIVGGGLVVGGMCLFMQRPTDQDVQKVRQSPKVIDLTDSKEAIRFNDLHPPQYQIRAYTLYNGVSRESSL